MDRVTGIIVERLAEAGLLTEADMQRIEQTRSGRAMECVTCGQSCQGNRGTAAHYRTTGHPRFRRAEA